MKIAIIGAGHVGGTLGAGWAQRGHEVQYGVRKPDATKTPHPQKSVAEAAAFGEVVVFATPWSAAQDAIKSAGDLTGKIVFDAMNPVKADFTGLEFDTSTSAGEKVAEWTPGARVVKIFNTAGFGIMANPQFGDQAATMFYCGDDAGAKEIAARLAADLGFAPEDAGPLTQARLLEPMAWLWITMAVKYGKGMNIAFKLLHR